MMGLKSLKKWGVLCCLIYGISICFLGCKRTVINDKATLGHFLFFEKKLSFNHTKSCASCHSPTFVFSDGYRRSVSSTGENLLHNAPSLINCSKLLFLDWAAPQTTTLAQQLKRPMYNLHPIEMGVQKHLSALQQFFQQDSLYSILFKKAFPNEKEKYTLNQIESCLVAYEMELNSKNSKYDEYLNGKKNVLNASEINGAQLFFSDRFKCSKCHAAPDFTLATVTKNTDSVYFNIGLYNVNNQNTYPNIDQGLIQNTHQPQDNGKFKVPSLRNVFLTAPYMHDGSIATLEEVIDFYARGGRLIDYGIYKGDGKQNKYKNKLIQGFFITENEKKDLINFLISLTDTTISSNDLFKNPFNIEK